MTGEQITYSGMTHIGLVREKNEDSYAIDVQNDHCPQMFIVCDGLGGHKNGELASRTAVEYATAHLRAALPSENDPYKVRSILEDVMQKTNVRVYLTSLESEENFGMGTTMTMMVIYERSCYVAHIGDSRCYLLRDNKLELLTEDDTYVHEMVVSGTITENESVSHPRRHILTQALGFPEYVRPDITHVDLLQNDRFLLSSDGLHGYVAFEKIQATMRHANDPESVASSLIEQTLEAGAPDNVTVVVVFA
ncbi:MAG TPA: Stp1/IreP family PP2C-type Ser/Thr phosphatase [Clostridiaceae bacterium]|jgi:serine/threonine protein phosphatase PrpC|nr:Stp1/IreP family PP2C-type Ser/Thr phosphatase [Clostridiaceae bacterium]